MSAFPFEAGRVVVSRAGHDKGKRFVVLSVLDENTVLIADGKSRRLDHPKKKKIRHLRSEVSFMEEIQTRTQSREKIYDHEIRKYLEQLELVRLAHKEG